MSVLRPVQHLEAVSRDYPGIWKRYAHFLSIRRDVGDWPRWCYCPFAAAVAVASGGRKEPNPKHAQDVARIAALAAWRPTQGIYRFDSTLLQSLLATPVDGDIPTEHLQRLPEWCVYVQLESTQPFGFFAHLEYDLKTSQAELLIVLDYPEQFLLVAIPLQGTLKSALEEFISRANLNPSRHLLGAATGLVEPFVSTLLYLCASGAEMRPTRDPQRTHEPAAPRRTRDGDLYLPPARRPEIWETGFQLGAALRRAEHAASMDATSPRGHIRRAHWHSYWVGTEESRRRELRWLPPIPVNLELPERPTLRHVKR